MANEFKVKKGLIVHGSGSTVLDIQGNSGQLFSVTDDLTGTLFTVSDISGIPIFEVDASGVSTFDGNVGIGTTSPSSLLHLGGTPGSLSSGLTFGDGDTGFYEVNDDTLGMSFGGSRRLRFSLTGVLSEFAGGMFIDYGSAGSSTNPVYSFNTDDNTGMGWGGSDTISLITGGSEKMRIDSAGKVGIGTTSPNHELVVQGTSNPNIELKNSNYSNGGFVLNRSNYTEQWKWWAESAGMYFSFATDEVTYSPLMTLKSNGNVGIGTTSPGFRLDVQTPTGNTLARFKDTDSSYDGIIIYGDTNAGWVGNDDVLSGEGIYYQNSINAMRIYTNDTEAMRIDSSGDVGIGTTSPDAKLHISRTAAGGTSLLLVENPDATNQSTAAQLQLKTGLNDASIKAVSGPGGAGYLSIFNEASEAIRIDSAGKVGIGTTSPSELLHLSTSTGTILKISNTGFGDVGMEIGCYSDAIRSVIQTTGPFGQLHLRSTNQIYMSTDSGVTTALFINNADNVGIGTTSPSAKLSVAGDVSISTNAHVQGKFLAGEDALPNSDHTLANGGSSAITPSTFAVNTVSGQILTGQTSGETLENGHLVYLRSNGSWYLADADQTATSTSLLGIALKDVTGVGSIDVLIDGVIGIEEDFVTFSNIGEPLYINTAGGKMTNTAPSGAGDVVRVVGHYLGADSTAIGVLVAFKPDGTWIEL